MKLLNTTSENEKMEAKAQFLRKNGLELNSEKDILEALLMHSNVADINFEDIEHDL
jgi:hypothetical protein